MPIFMGTGTITTGLFLQSLNQVIDLHSKRVFGLYSRIPISIWVALCINSFHTIA